MKTEFDWLQTDFAWSHHIYTHDTAIKNSQVHHWSLKTKIYMIYF